jgi:hypothetical protein
MRDMIFLSIGPKRVSVGRDETVSAAADIMVSKALAPAAAIAAGMMEGREGFPLPLFVVVFLVGTVIVYYGLRNSDRDPAPQRHHCRLLS